MKYISDFLAGYSTRPTTLGYRAAIYSFLDSKYGSVRKKKDSTSEEREQYEKLAVKYMKGKVLPLADLKGYKDYLTTKQRPPHSISQGVTCVRIWLEHYEHELSSKDIRELKKYMPTEKVYDIIDQVYSLGFREDVRLPMLLRQFDMLIFSS